MSLLAADIGGTWSRLALEDGGRERRARYRNADFPDLGQVIARFLADSDEPGARIERMVLALPGPVDETPVRLTNIDWTVDPEALRACCPHAEIRLVNDFQAAAVGARASRAGRWLNPHAAPPATQGTAVVSGAGTGLGLAWFGDVAQAALPHATEGGHADFAPADARQRELHAWLQARHGHVSWERVLSGPGLGEVHAFLAGQDAALHPAEVQERARAGDPQAAAAIALFLRVYGNWAGCLALLFRPPAGIHLCGGVTVHLAPWFGEDFLAAYLARGRMRAVAERTPLRLVEDPDIGLAGALAIARGARGSEAQR